MSDADVDAEVDATPPGPVTLTSYWYDARVYFLRRDGSLIDAKTVTANSSVTVQDVPLGSSVTAVVTDCCGRTGYDITAFLHVHPDDHLYVGTASSSVHTTPTFTITRDTDPDVTGYGVRLPVPYGGQITQLTDSGSSTQVATNLFGPTPSTETTIDVLLRSLDQNNAMQNYIFIPGVVLADSTQIDLTATAWSAPTTRQVTVSNLPTSPFMSALVRVLSPRGVIDYAVANLAQNGTAALAAATFTGAVDSYSVTWGDTATYRSTHSWGPAGTTLSIDVASHVLPTLSPASYNATTGTVSWTENGTSTVSANFVATSLVGDRGTRWTVFGPHDGTSITLPRLPVESVDYSIHDADNPHIWNVQIGNIPSGHQAALDNPYWSATLGGPVHPVAPSTGTIETSFWLN